ncbi:HNH endonuclease [Cellulosimicrobium sp. I38E]|uniref:HNH endonuclease n=1 Tax=Cellulosimicrobium sp. I38E TaxID=1393139 RepID=UPI0007B1CC52|nr:HNH endonuclease [Cellulosimicrobium sp. I38E]KZM78204.1 hypothetical protein A0J59_14725 [Cellulosimicrobium sp. I38E]
MGIGLADRKALWVQSGNACAFPDCRRSLFEVEDEVSGSPLIGAGIVVGEEAHIRAQSPGGPRYDPDYPNVDSYANLVLLCPTHHTIIDKSEPENWPVKRLEKLKTDHEMWVRGRRSAAAERTSKTEILVAADVQRIEDHLFARWPAVHWQLNRPIPTLSKTHFEAVAQAGRFLLAKDWPSEFPAVAQMAERLRHLIAMLCEHITNEFEQTHEPDGPLKLFRAEKQLRTWDPPTYKHLFHETQVNMVTSWWLGDRLTYELNQWIRAVRDELDVHYRFAEGVILVPVGDGIIEPVADTRYDYDLSTPLPALPTGLTQLKDAVEQTAEERGVEPQRVHPSELTFPIEDD